MSDIDTVVVDSLKALDPNRPIREADIERLSAPTQPVAIEPKAVMKAFSGGDGNCSCGPQHGFGQYRSQSIERQGSL